MYATTQESSVRTSLRLDEGWAFHLGDAAGAQGKTFDASAWKSVTLPHDWSIGLPIDPDAPSKGDGGYFPTGIGWYRHTFSAPESWRDRRVWIEFEGAYMNTEVWLNGVSLGRHPYGYTPFWFDLTPHLKLGETNTLAVRVDSPEQPSSRWYNGSGLYRPVRLHVTNAVHAIAEEIFVATSQLTDQAAVVQVHVPLRNETASARVVDVEISLSPEAQPSQISSTKLSGTLAANGRWTPVVSLEVRDPRPWSPESPSLYTATIKVIADGKVVDLTSTAFGIRTVRVSADRGFELNGKPVKINGGNVHHDNGPLGAAAFDAAEWRKVKLLKSAGFNTARTAHNPPSKAFLEACDRLGLLVIDEIFDGWEKGKNKQDYNVYFREWWRHDVTAWVKRDRNHPSVIMWSTGNEMFERTNAEGQRIARQLADRIRDLDTTRPVTAGVNGAGAGGKWSQLDPLFATLDVAGYNYELYQHADDHQRLPSRVMMASESYQTEVFTNWAITQDHAYVIGDVVWSALDYLGEAGIGRVYPPDQEAKKHWEGSMYPWHGAYCGDIDITGWRKPISYYRNIVWDRGEKLYTAVFQPAPDGKAWNTTPWSLPPSLSSWTWPGLENTPVTIEVYSRHDAVRLLVNGHAVGEQPTTREQGFKATFTTPYTPGELKVEGLRDGKVAETFVLKTASEAKALRLTAENSRIRADGQDLAFISVEAVDANGIWHPAATPTVTFTVEGPGSLAAVGTGDMTSMESYQGDSRTLFQGRGIAIVRTTKSAGEIVVTASAPGFAPAKITILSAQPR